jgi:excisionase family DNA binding protein
MTTLRRVAVEGVPARGPVPPQLDLDRFRGRLFLTVADVAAITATDPRTLRRGIEGGEIPAVRIGRTIRIPAALFWPQVCGLDPTTLQPLDIATSAPDSSAASPSQGLAAASIHTLAKERNQTHDPATPTV